MADAVSTGTPLITGRPLLANAPLRLAADGDAWILERGRAVVVASVRDERGQTIRRPVFAVGAGDLLLPPPPSSPVELVAVAVEEGSFVRPAPRAALRESAAAGDDFETLALVERWLGAVAGAIDAPLPQGGASLTGDDAVRLLPGQAAWAASRMVWVRAEEPLRPYRGQPVTGVDLPVPPRSWLQATGATELHVRTGTGALARSEGWAGVDAFLRAAYERLYEQLTSLQAEDARRIEQRHSQDEEMRAETYTALGAILGGRRQRALLGEGDPLLTAMRLAGAALGIEIVAAPPSSFGQFVEPVDAIARASGVRTRKISLEGDWWKQDAGPLVATVEQEGTPVALLPRRLGYEVVDPVNGVRRRLTPEVAATLASEAIVLYRPLPSHALSGRDLWRFLLRPMRADLRRLLLFGLATGALSLVTPIAAEYVFSTVVPGLQRGTLIWVTALLAVFAVSSFSFVLAQQIAVLRLEGRSSTDLQAALWDRLLDLPLPFFRRFSAGNLTMRVMGIERIRSLATATVATAALAVPVGITNLVLAFVLQPRLALFGLVAIAGIVASIYWLVRYQTPREAAIQEAAQQLFSVAIQLVDAVGKLRVADAEERGYAQWVKRFGAMKQSFFDSQLGFAAITAFTGAATAIATAFFFIGASTTSTDAISGATFIAFNTAFLQVIWATVGLTSLATFFAQAVPIFENTTPILQEERETTAVKTDPGELRGAIEVSHVTMRYLQDGPVVLDDVTFAAEPGEFVAIVGPSGSGKSSLMRVLLGFETPELGSVRFDGKELDSLDLRSVRRQMGVVVQTARLLPADIYTNIVGTRSLSIDDAWEAARTAGIAAEIEELPMQMHTWIAEGTGSFSGGQKQRILIARAVVGRPRILLFDEATSALDNRTQREVSDAIERLRATRVVIAHRLSTVRRADKILVLVAGRIVQSGTYDELVEAEGPFRALAQRQLA